VSADPLRGEARRPGSWPERDSVHAESAGRDKAPRRAGLGCALMVLASPVVGFGAWAATSSFVLGFAAWSFTLLVAALWTGWQLANAEPRMPARPVWSFNPLSAGVIAATDVVALTGDAVGAGTAGIGYLFIVGPIACAAAAIVFLLELVESKSLLHALAKSAAAAFLVALPTPVGGLVGAGASLGHRLLTRGRSESPPPG
jgi:hypothetical protein